MRTQRDANNLFVCYQGILAVGAGKVQNHRSRMLIATRAELGANTCARRPHLPASEAEEGVCTLGLGQEGPGQSENVLVVVESTMADDVGQENGNGCAARIRRLGRRCWRRPS